MTSTTRAARPSPAWPTRWPLRRVGQTRAPATGEARRSRGVARAGSDGAGRVPRGGPGALRAGSWLTPGGGGYGYGSFVSVGYEVVTYGSVVFLSSGRRKTSLRRRT